MSYITALGTANPPFKFSQSQLAEFMVKAMNLSQEEAEELRLLYRASGVGTRYSVISDYGSLQDYSFYPNTGDLEPFPSTKERLQLFREHALTLSKQAVQRCLYQVPDIAIDKITHLIAVSCTGMFAPGLDIDLIHQLKFKSTIQRTNITFMGCYAAFNALRVADSFCHRDPKAKVLIVCTELCSLHFQKEKTQDNKLANALFGDGSAAVLVEATPGKGLRLKIGNFFCDLTPDAQREMAWEIGDYGFEMRLSTYVPMAIKKGIRKLACSLLAANKISLSDVDYFAIHPGGKKILEAIEQELELEKIKNKFAYQVMRNYGNMSSPTVLFVLQGIFAQLTRQDDQKKILSFGFGPGLTLESLILTIEHT